MRTKKPNTLQQKLGFLDDDLRKPKHDDIMLWLDRNIEAVLRDIFFKPLTDLDYDELFKNAKKQIEIAINDRMKTISSLEGQLERSRTSKVKIKKTGEEEITQEIEKENKKIKYLQSWSDFESKPLRPV
jgi:hypothetical protein